MKTSWKKVIAILVPLLLIALITGVVLIKKARPSVDSGSAVLSKTDFYFDTMITITLYDETDTALFDECFDLCAHYENLLSHTVEGSDIWKINHAGGQPVEVDKMTAFLISEALKYSELTNGVFDISIAKAANLWDFEDHNADLPDASKLSEAVAHIDYHNIKLDENTGGKPTVTLEDPAMEITLGAVAKGFIADELKDLLIKKGVSSALINLGGNVQAVGAKPDGTAFNVGIQEPFADEGTPIAVASVNDDSLVTSGPYERYIEKDGEIYHHILDPKTGYAIENNLESVSILCSSSLQADALSTSVFLLGLEAGSEMIRQTDGVSALLITDDMEFHPVGDFPLQ